jgi:hypothetical protein
MAQELWKCEYCYTHYETNQEALQCESLHQSIESISNLYYNKQSSFPYKFDVKLENGREFTYHIVPSPTYEGEEE